MRASPREFLGQLPLATMRVRTRVARPGKRIEMLEATVESGGRDVLDGARVAHRNAAGRQHPAPRRRRPIAVPPIPDAAPVPGWMSTLRLRVGVRLAQRATARACSGPAAVWSRPRVPLIAGEPLDGLDRALLVADSANGVSAELPMQEWLFVPPSLSLALERYTRGEWTLLEARTTLTSDGIGMTTLRLADTDGYLGAGTQALLVEKRA